MYQFNQERDTELNECERRLANVIASQEALATEHNQLWDKIFFIMDALVTPGTVRFICQDEWVLAKEERKGSPRLDTDQLFQLIFKKYEETEAHKIWNKITTLHTERVLDQTKLAKVVEAGILEPEIVQVSTAPGKVTNARARRRASKTDREALARGIFTLPAEAAEEATA